MRGVSLADGLQAVGAVAILFGLGLVIYELRQSHEIAGAQLVAQQYDSIASRYHTLMGEDSADILAKACAEPESLTPTEQRVVNAYFHAEFLTVRRLRALSERGDFTAASEYWQGWAAGSFGVILGYPDGRIWWQNTRETYADIFPDAVALGDQIATSLGDEYQCRAYYDDWSAAH